MQLKYLERRLEKSPDLKRSYDQSSLQSASVLNGAAKFHGHSLNNALLTGPDLLQSLIHVLLRFRQYQHAVSADIEGMFLQVGVIPADQSSLRFLWREDPATEVAVYQYARHILAQKTARLAQTTR